MEGLHDAVIRKVGDGLRPVYGMSLTPASAGVTRKLGEVPLHIDPKRNTEIRRSPGVNQSSVYAAGRGAVTVFHTEDGHLDSCNLILYGERQGIKLWLLVHPDYFTDTSLVLQEAFKLMFRRGEDVSDWRNGGCPAPHFHKRVAVTAEFLRSKGIGIQVVVQRPGDMVYVGSGVLHQVVNIGVNVAEAVNVGGPAWNVLGGHFIPCGCPGCVVVGIRSNPHTQGVVCDRPRQVYICTHKECGFSTRKVEEYRAHLAQHERPPGSAEVYWCAYCGARYVHKQSLVRHVNVKHLGLGREICTWCLEEQSPLQLMQHQERCYKAAVKSVVGVSEGFIRVDPMSLLLPGDLQPPRYS